MRPLVVVVKAILPDDRLKVTLVDDEHAIEAFSTAASDPALRMCISSGCHQWSQDHQSTLRLEDAIGLTRELPVPIVDQDAYLDPFVLEPPAEIAGLLGDPGSIRGRGATRHQASA